MTDSNTPVSAPQNNNAVIGVYIVVCGSMLMSLVPTLWAAGAAAILFFLGIIFAYAVRFRAEKDSLAADHMTYILRSIRFGSGLAILTIGIASIYMLCRQDVQPLMACADNIMDSGDMSQLSPEALKPCIENYLAANKFMIFIAAAIGILPVIVYFIYRFTKGFARALKGYRISTPKEKMSD
jgi:uncharacterized membrane protein